MWKKNMVENSEVKIIKKLRVNFEELIKRSYIKRIGII